MVAEKFQAIVVLGQVNSRIMDDYDLFALALMFHFDGELLCAALRATFERRLTPIPEDAPLGLSDGFATDPRKIALWTAFVRREQLLHDTADFGTVIEDIKQFVMPPTKPPPRRRHSIETGNQAVHGKSSEDGEGNAVWSRKSPP